MLLLAPPRLDSGAVPRCVASCGVDDSVLLFAMVRLWCAYGCPWYAYGVPMVYLFVTFDTLAVRASSEGVLSFFLPRMISSDVHLHKQVASRV